MSSLEKRKKKPSQIQKSIPIPTLPDDLLVSCFSRISRFDYPSLSLVSKSFRSVIASPELYEARSSLGNTETCLYVCVQSPHPDPYSRWITLCPKPDTTTSEFVFAPISTSHSPLAHWSGLVALGSNIYNIWNAQVYVLDCRSNTWREAPSILVKRKNPKVNVVDGKIYVAGGCKECNSTNWMEVFDPKTQTWELVSSPLLEICESSYIEKSAVIDGKMYIYGNNIGFVYEPKEGKWEKTGLEMDLGWVWHCCCVIGNVLYCYNINGEFKWYDIEVRVRRVLKVVKRLPRLPRDCVKLADFGGKMAVLWEKISGSSSGYKNKKIWCAVVALERGNTENICGQVEWFDEVLTVPKSYSLEYAVATTI